MKEPDEQELWVSCQGIMVWPRRIRELLKVYWSKNCLYFRKLLIKLYTHTHKCLIGDGSSNPDRRTQENSEAVELCFFSIGKINHWLAYQHSIFVIKMWIFEKHLIWSSWNTGNVPYRVTFYALTHSTTAGLRSLY